MRSLGTCLVYSCAVVFTLITLSTPAEEEAVFIRGVNTNEDPPNAHQAQHQEEEEVVVVVFTRENGAGGGGLYS